MNKLFKQKQETKDYKMGYIDGCNQGYKKAVLEIIELIECGLYQNGDELKESLQLALKKNGNRMYL